MKLKKAKMILYVLMIVTIILTVFCYTRQLMTPGTIACIAVLLGAYLVCWRLLWKCPHCGEHLGKMNNAIQCKHCGENLYQKN